MTKEILISISGLQYDLESAEVLEVISPGEYYFRNGKHYVIYEEILEEDELSGAVTKCTLKISSEQIEIIKRGVANVHMVFELNKNHMSYYNTIFGELIIGITTKQIKFSEEDKKISLLLVYDLDMNYQHISECNLTITITQNGQIPIHEKSELAEEISHFGQAPNNNLVV